MSERSPKQEFLLIFILGALTTIGPLSIDLYLPAFPEIANSFQSDIASVSYSLSSFFLGLALGQLMYGPLLERFGRKRPVYVGLVVFMLASLGCALSNSVTELVIYRFFQALGGCAGMVASRAVVRDLFDGNKVAIIFSRLMMVIAVSPIIGPTVGGIISANFGWQAVFVVLILLVALIGLGTIFILPETKTPDPTYPMDIKAIAKSYASVFVHPVFFVNTIAGGLSYAGLHAYISGSPLLYMEILGLDEQAYGKVFAIIAVGIISASQLNGIFLKRMESRKLIMTALVIQTLIAGALLMTNLIGVAGLIVSTALIFSFLFCLGIILPNASALALAPMKKVAGSASALLGAAQMAIGASASALVGFLQIDTSVPMALVMAICSTLSLSLFYFGGKKVAVPQAQVLEKVS